jgi:predicted DNA-binding transcriptional regulator YafY
LPPRRMNRQQKAAAAITFGKPLRFNYMKLGEGRRDVESRTVTPISLAKTKDGRVVLTAEDWHRGDGRPRSFRMERMFNVEVAA